MSEIKVQCIDQAISFLNTPVISSGNVNYDTIHFDFCSRWDGYAKTAIFYRNKDEVYYQLLENDSCIIPNEVLGEKGVIYIGVFGTQGDKTITSQVLTYRIQEGAVTEDLKPSDPTPDIYAQIISRYNDYDTRLAYFEERFNGSVGDAEKLGGQLPEYYASAESVRNIQTSYQADFSTEGWYRVAEFSGSTSSNLTGDRANTVDLIVKRTYSNTDNEYHILRLRSTFKKQEIVSLDSKSNTQIFTKARITYEFNDTTKKSYFELYYKSSSRNSVCIIVNNAQTAYTTWRAISPTITEESQSGITILTTYDIPANASPVTDLDVNILAHTFKGQVDVSNFDDLVEAGSYYCNVQSGVLNSPHDTNNGFIIVEVASEKIYHTFVSRADYKTRKRCRYTASVWSPWREEATTADLANYLSLNGGNIRGTIRAYGNTYSSFRVVNDENTIDAEFLQSNGNFGIWDNKLSEWVMRCIGANRTFNGTATGNVALSGTGQTVSAPNTVPLAVKNTDTNTCYIPFYGPDGLLGHIGFAKADDAVLLNSKASTVGRLLHTGNVGNYALPLNGGGTILGNVRVNSDTLAAITLHRRDSVGSAIAFSNESGVLGHLGMSADKIPTFYETDASKSYKIHHDGNSAKVVVSETPLTASGSIRVW